MHTPAFGILGAAAATPLAQRQGEADRAHHDAAHRQQQTAIAKQAESAAGIGEADRDQPAADRDADGRRLWESAARRQGEEDDDASRSRSPAKDPTGQTGSHLDLTG